MEYNHLQLSNLIGQFELELLQMKLQVKCYLVSCAMTSCLGSEPQHLQSLANFLSEALSPSLGCPQVKLCPLGGPSGLGLISKAAGWVILVVNSLSRLLTTLSHPAPCLENASYMAIQTTC